MLYLMFGCNLVHHGYEDMELGAQLHDQCTQGVHGCALELRGGVEGSSQWVNDTGGKVSQV